MFLIVFFAEGSSGRECRGDGDDKQWDSTKENTQKDKITVNSFMLWLTGQGHVPITSAKREKNKKYVEFDHDCRLWYCQHSICYPLLNACFCTMTLPTWRLGTYTEFLYIISQAVSNQTIN